MSIKTETVTVNGRKFTRTYSTSGKYIRRGGVKYAEAVDPADIAREYAETDEDIPVDGKFTPEEDETGADGTEAHPYAFAPGVACVPNAYYTAPTKYVYMPADAEKHAYDSWADAAADMVEWGE